METRPGDLLLRLHPRLIQYLFNALSSGVLAMDRAGMVTLADAMPDALVVVNREGRILLANREIQHLTGHDPQALQGQFQPLALEAEGGPSGIVHQAQPVADLRQASARWSCGPRLSCRSTRARRTGGKG